MKKIRRKKDDWGQEVIYVEECSKYKFEIQPDLPLLNRKERIYITTNRLPTKEDFDKIK